MEAYSLFEVNQYIKRVIALNFEEAVWVECEINQISSSRNNVYLELIEKQEDSDEVIAKASATLWYRQYLFIKKKLGKIADDVLKAGIKVKIKTAIEFSERYGLSLNILDIDPAFTFGQFELNRQKTIERLQNENLIERNRNISLPRVIQKIAVISSETAAGYKDFMDELVNNEYGYTFHTDLFAAAMQGQNTEKAVVEGLNAISYQAYDIIVLIRGGGSKLDLSAFDSYKIAATIATAPLPVLTGIGHEIDQSVCDIVSHTSLKTPTAVANFILDNNMNFEYEIGQHLMLIGDLAKRRLNDTKLLLSEAQSTLSNFPKILINDKKHQLASLQDKCLSAAKSMIGDKKQSLLNIEQNLEWMNPSNILKKGFTLVRDNHKYITRKSDIPKDSKSLEIEFYDGKYSIKT